MNRASGLEGLEQLHLAVVSGNQPAVSLYEGAGFTVYSTTRQAFKHDGRYWDEHFMALFLA
nr:GNAT family protein [Paenibacillus protaetiae]